MHSTARARQCGVCGGPLRGDNATGICVRTPECRRIRAEKTRRARGIGPIRDTLRERLLSNLIITPSGCLLWRGQRDGGGYGKIRVGDRIRSVHIVMWELFEGPVPDGLELDHVKALGCANRHCASIAHLEPVTHRENVIRGTSAGRHRGPRAGHSSQYKGVTWNRTAGKWQATIRIAGKNRYLGIFASEEDAARAYDVVTIEAFGTSAYLNLPEAVGA